MASLQAQKRPRYTKGLVKEVRAIQHFLINIVGTRGTYNPNVSSPLDVEYMELVRELNRLHPNRRNLLPLFLKSELSLSGVLSRVQRIDEGPAKAVVDGMFSPFWEAAPPSLRKYGPSSNAKSTSSSSWTGRRSKAQQLVLVQTLVPVAMQAIDQLIDAEAMRAHNGSPDADSVDALRALRELHSSLGELLSLADAGKPVTASLKAISRMATAIFEFSRPTGLLAVKNLETGAGSIVPAGCTIWALERLFGSPIDVGSAATLAAGYIASGAALTASKAKKQ